MLSVHGNFCDASHVSVVPSSLPKMPQTSWRASSAT